MYNDREKPILTVSQLNQSVKQLLDYKFDNIWLIGEISNFSQPVSGHWYFTLKDTRSQVRCAMFRTANRNVKFTPQHGQQVLVHAFATLYEARGDYQLIIQSIQLAGDGLLQQEYEKLKQRLQQKGLFQAIYKKPLPQPASCLGIITSSTGAAIYDILNILKRRDPSLPIIIYPTAVQGNDAAKQIANAIKIANQRAECDVLIVGRGGGSLEDLWPFNEEVVAQAIFDSQIPIVSAVGHEVDVTIADFVADLRAPTPSAAAELVSRDQKVLIRQLSYQQQQATMAMDYYLADKKIYLTIQINRLQQQHPQVRVTQQLHLLLKKLVILQENITHHLRKQTDKLNQLTQRLHRSSPNQLIVTGKQLLQDYFHQQQQAIKHRLYSSNQRLAISVSQLDIVSPLATLNRGYSISTDKQKNILKSISQLQLQQHILTELSDGRVESKIIKITEKNHN